MAEQTKTKWAPVQLKAIESRNENLLVSASAGSGKTTVMIGRIIDLIKKSGASLDKMLICTFTRASASDMKEKLYKNLLKMRGESDDPKRFDEQISLIPLADISTIDSWCVKLVRNYFYAIGVDPAFEILDEKESDAMLMQAIDDALGEALSKDNNEDFLVLYESMYSRRSDSKFRKLIAQVYGFAMTQANPEEWLKNSLKYYDGSYASVREELYEKEKRGYLAECDVLLKRVAGFGVAKAFNCVQDLSTALSQECELPTMSYKDIDSATAGKMRKLRDKIKKFLDKKQSLNYDPIQTNYAQQIVDFTLAVIKNFEADKERKAVMDFSDCEHKAYQILCNDDILQDVKDKYSYVFVDEYQDINPLQEAIINKLKKEGNMFFVGDIKQSIYAFRNCDPAIFRELYDNHKAYGFAPPIDFVTNYRCGQNIIDFVNEVFVPLMTKDFGGVNYSDYQLTGFDGTGKGEVRATVYKPTQKAEFVECDYDINVEEDADNTEKLAETIICDIAENLDKIREEMQKKEKSDDDEEKERTVFSNIAVLTPKRNELTSVLYEKMKERGIPVHIAKELYFSSNPTVRYILDVLTFIDDNEDDVAFVSTITSPYFAITPKEVVLLCKERNADYSVSSYARWYADKKNDELSQKLKHVFEFFDKYIEKSMFMTVKDTVSEIIVEMDYFDNIIRNRGVKEADKLAMFLDSLNSCPYADTINNYLKYVLDGGDKCEIKPESDCINIMTVHASKGLEFPYVYFINSEAQVSNHDNGTCLTDKELGLCIKTIDEENKTYEDNALYTLMKEIADKKLKEEKARLLYVALTRPQIGLYIYASVKETKTNNFYDNVPISSDTLFGWMSEAIIKLGYKTVDGNDVKIEKKKSNKDIIDVKNADEKYVNKLKERFDKMQEIYSLQSSDSLKTSVTQIASEETEDMLPQMDEERSFRRKSKEDPVKKGNAYHKTMEILDFSLDFEQAYEKVENAGILDFELVKKEKIRSAYNAVKPLLENGKAYKEKSFIYNGGKLVQGIIDLLIIRDSGAIVVDYKTTSLYSLAQEKTMLEYQIQVGIYAKAVSEIIGLNVEKVMLYSFEKDDFIELKSTQN